MAGNVLRPVVIDIKASGFGLGSYPVEIGVVLEDGGGYCALVKPEPEWTHWDLAAERHHGLTRRMLVQYGQPVATVARQLNTLLEGRTVYSDARENDASRLDLLFHHAGRRQLFKLESLHVLLPEDRLSIWNRAKRETIDALKLSRRRASADARILQLAVGQCVSGRPATVRLGPGNRANGER